MCSVSFISILYVAENTPQSLLYIEMEGHRGEMLFI